MATLIPSLSTCVSRMTAGERRLAERLEHKLDADYLLWYDVPVGPKQAHPDFVVLHQMVNPATNSLLLLYDDAQSIYERRRTRQFSFKSVGVQARGRTTVLKINDRNTRQVLQTASLIAADLLRAEERDDDGILLLQSISCGREWCVHGHRASRLEVLRPAQARRHHRIPPGKPAVVHLHAA